MTEEVQGGPLTACCRVQHLHLAHVLSTAINVNSPLEINCKGSHCHFSLPPPPTSLGGRVNNSVERRGSSLEVSATAPGRVADTLISRKD
ncbi:unnamed protein product [Hymenolepis diminuta]|uniref:Uncharacterized protein n=1 Tax=Hymenolepis diminuta TaxID=6216 RepID=A0A564YSF7_HYMDI|nr:unnamed protein product [Hymenolepis diminuta]